MRSYEERLELARKNLDIQKETLRIVTLRERQGLVTELDVQQATANLGRTESLIPSLQTGRRMAENRLCILMAEPPNDLARSMRSPGMIPNPPQEVIVGIPAQLLLRRPDVRQAERQAAAQSARIGIAAADFYPHIAITGTIGLQAERLNQLFEAGSLVGSIGPGISWNILNYGRIVNNVRSQDAQFQQAVLNYRDTVLRANEEVENGIVSFLNEQDRVRSLDKTRAGFGALRAVGDVAVRKGADQLSAALGFAARPLAAARRPGPKPRHGGRELDRHLPCAPGGGWRARLAGPQAAAAQPVPPGTEIPVPAPLPEN